MKINKKNEKHDASKKVDVSVAPSRLELKREIIHWIKIGVITMVLYLIINLFVFPAGADGSSMLSTFIHGDLIGLISLFILMLVISGIMKYKGSGYDRRVMYVTEKDFERIDDYYKSKMKSIEVDVFIL